MSWTRTGFTGRKADLCAGHPKAEKKPRSLLQSWQNLQPLCRKEKLKSPPLSSPLAQFYQRMEFWGQWKIRPLNTHHTEDRMCVHKIGHWPSKSVLAPPRGPFSQHKPCSSSDPGRKQQVCTNRSDQKYMNEDGWLKLKFIRKAETNRKLWGGIKVAEVQRKLQMVRMCAKGLCSSFHFEWGGSFKLQKVHGQKKHATDPHLNLNLLTWCVCACVSPCVFSSYSEAWEAVSPKLSQQRPPCGVQWRLWWCMWRLTSIWTHPEGN